MQEPSLERSVENIPPVLDPVSPRECARKDYTREMHEVLVRFPPSGERDYILNFYPEANSITTLTSNGCFGFFNVDFEYYSL